MGQYQCKTVDSKYGEITILWKLINDMPKIHRIYLGTGNMAAAKDLSRGAREQNCEMIDETARDILRFFSGEAVEFDLGHIDLDVCSAFQRKVILTEYEVPRGYVSTYKRIANRINKPNGARAVGNALARNPFPIIIPCHRVIKSDGALGGYGGGRQMKYQLLKMEGIKFNNRREILPGQLFY
jgi:methylated-DNA-[protein]-cysteine S-methyltransferase